MARELAIVVADSASFPIRSWKRMNALMAKENTRLAVLYRPRSTDTLTLAKELVEQLSEVPEAIIKLWLFFPLLGRQLMTLTPPSHLVDISLVLADDASPEEQAEIEAKWRSNWKSSPNSLSGSRTASPRGTPRGTSTASGELSTSSTTASPRNHHKHAFISSSSSSSSSLTGKGHLSPPGRNTITPQSVANRLLALQNSSSTSSTPLKLKFTWVQPASIPRMVQSFIWSSVSVSRRGQGRSLGLLHGPATKRMDEMYVAVSVYQYNNPAIPPLPGAKNDSNKLAEIARKRSGAACFVGIDNPLNADDIRAALKAATTKWYPAHLVLYWSGHAVVDIESGPRFVTASGHNNDAMTPKGLIDVIAGLPHALVGLTLVLDVCHAGHLRVPILKALESSPLTGVAGRISIIGSSGEWERASDGLGGVSSSPFMSEVFSPSFEDEIDNGVPIEEVLAAVREDSVAWASPTQSSFAFTWDGGVWEQAEETVLYRKSWLPFLRSMTEDFVGRSWLCDDVQEWLQSDTRPRMLFLNAVPGLGKTAWLSAVVMGHKFRRSLIGYHFCRFDEADSLSGIVWLRNMICRMQRALGPARVRQRDILRRIRDTVAKNDESQVKAVLLDYVRGLDPKVPVKLMIAVDSLDEANDSTLHGHKNVIIDCLDIMVRYGPSWLKVLATSRNDADVKSRLTVKYESMTMQPDAERNLNDIREYLESLNIPEDEIEPIIKASGGNFLFTRMAVREGLIGPEGISTHLLPNGLIALYSNRTHYLFPDQADFEETLPVLNVLVAAKGAMPRAVLEVAAKIGGASDKKTVNRVLDKLSSTISSQGNGLVQIYHQSFAEWCKQVGWKKRAGDPAVTANDVQGHYALARACLELLHKHETYVTNHLVTHAAGSKDREVIEETCSRLSLSWNWMKRRAAMTTWGVVAEDLEALGGVAKTLGKIIRQWMMHTGSSAAVADGLVMYAPAMIADEVRREVGAHPMWPWRDWCPALRTTIFGGQGRIKVLADMGDERFVAGGFKNSICVYDARSGTRQAKELVGHKSDVAALTVLPGGRHLISGSWDKTIRSWDLTDLSRTSATSTVIGAFAHWVTGVAAVSESSFVSCDRGGGLHLWELDLNVGVHAWKITQNGWNDPKELHEREPLKALVVIPHAGVLAYGGRGKTVNCRRLDGQEQWIKVMRGHESDVTSLAVLGSGNIVSGSWDGTVKIWSWDNQLSSDALGTLVGHSRGVNSVTVLNDGIRIASTGDDATVRIWDSTTSSCLGVLRGHTQDVNALCVITSEGEMNGTLVSGSRDTTMTLWDPEAQYSTEDLDRGVMQSNHAVTASVVLADGQVCTGLVDGAVRVFQAPVHGSYPKVETDLLRLGDAEVAAVGKEVSCMVETKNGFAAAHCDGTVVVWREQVKGETRRWAFEKVGKKLEDWAKVLVVMPDDETLVALSYVGDLYFMSVGRNKDRFTKLTRLADPEATWAIPHTLVVLDDTNVVTGDSFGVVRKWNVVEGCQVGAGWESNPDHVIKSMLVVDGGRALITGSSTGMKLWNAGTPSGQWGDAHGVGDIASGDLVVDAEVGDNLILAHPYRGRRVELWAWRGEKITARRLRYLVHVEDDIMSVMWDAENQRLIVLSVRGVWVAYDKIQSVGLLARQPSQSVKKWNAEDPVEDLALFKSIFLDYLDRLRLEYDAEEWCSVEQLETARMIDQLCRPYPHRQSDVYSDKDVLLLTTEPVETAAVVRSLEGTVHKWVIDGHFYWAGKIGVLSVVVCKVYRSTMGIQNSEAVVGKAIDVWHPRLAIATGFCHGFTRSLETGMRGDVVIGHSVFPHENLKVKRRSSKALKVAPPVQGSPADLARWNLWDNVRFVENLKVDTVFGKEGPLKEWTGTPDSGSDYEPQLRHGMIVSGAKLPDASDMNPRLEAIVDTVIRSRHQESALPLVAGDLEAKALHAACTKGLVPCITVQGLASFYSDVPPDEPQSTDKMEDILFASWSSARVVWEALRIGQGSWVKELGRAPPGLRLLPQRGFLTKKVERFVGREALSEKVEEWRRDLAGQPLCLVTGPPGVGKSAWVAHLVEKNPMVLGYHVCRFDDATTQDGRMWLSNVVAQVLQGSPGMQWESAKYATVMESVIDVVSGAKSDVISTFVQFITGLVSDHQVKQRGGSFLLVVDALDEAFEHADGVVIVEALKTIVADRNLLPPWLKIVATTRRDSRVLAELSGLYKEFPLDPESEENYADILEWMSEHWPSKTPDEVQALIAECEGNFAVLRHILNPTSSGKVDRSGSARQYARRAARRWRSKEQFEEIAPLVSILVAADGWIPWQIVAAAYRETGKDDFQGVSDRLSIMIEHKEHGEDRSVRLNPSFAVWVQRRGWRPREEVEMWTAEQLDAAQPGHVITGDLGHRLLTKGCVKELLGGGLSWELEAAVDKMWLRHSQSVDGGERVAALAIYEASVWKLERSTKGGKVGFSLERFVNREGPIGTLAGVLQALPAEADVAEFQKRLGEEGLSWLIV